MDPVFKNCQGDLLASQTPACVPKLYTTIITGGVSNYVTSGEQTTKEVTVTQVNIYTFTVNVTGYQGTIYFNNPGLPTLNAISFAPALPNSCGNVNSKGNGSIRRNTESRPSSVTLLINNIKGGSIPHDNRKFYGGQSTLQLEPFHLTISLPTTTGERSYADTTYKVKGPVYQSGASSSLTKITPNPNKNLFGGRVYSTLTKNNQSNYLNSYTLSLLFNGFATSPVSN